IRDGHVTGVQTCALPICKGTEALSIEVEAKELSKVVSSSSNSNAIISLKISGNGGSSQEHLAMITEVQRDVFQKQTYHVDFHKKIGRASCRERAYSRLGA